MANKYKKREKIYVVTVFCHCISHKNVKSKTTPKHSRITVSNFISKKHRTMW